MKKAYWVGIVNVKNHNEYKKYTDIAGPALIAAGAKILSRGGKIINLEGKEMNRLVVIEFPSMEHAESFYNSEEYKPVRQIRLDNSVGNVIIIKGAK